jgi:hypothetical protein
VGNRYELSLADHLLVAVERVGAVCSGVHVRVWHRGAVAIAAIEWCAVVHIVPSVAGVTTPRLETEETGCVRLYNKKLNKLEGTEKDKAYEDTNRNQ